MVRRVYRLREMGQKPDLQKQRLLLSCTKA